MSEFRLTGDYYVSEWNGDDANAGTDPNNPLYHPSAAPNNRNNLIVVGSGYYFGGFSGERNIIGDGYVVLDCNSENVNFRDKIENVYLKNTGISPIGGSAATIIDCIFETVPAPIRSVNIIRNLFLTDIFFDMNLTILNCLFLSNVTGSRRYSFCFFSKSSDLIFNVSPTGSDFNIWQNNIINGIISINGNPYELKRLFDGSTRPDADPLIDDLIDVFPNVYTQGNFAGDPKFLDILNRIVSPDSDLLKSSNANGFIGGVKAGRVIPVSTTEPNVTVTSERINTSDPQNWVIQTSEDDGWIDMKFRVSSQIVQCPVINFIAQLAFDGSVAGGTAGNNNVPDATPESYTPLSQPNLKPNRLVYLFRSSKSVNIPTTDAGWDNDGDTIGTPVIAGDFYAMEWSNGNRVAPFIRNNGGVAYGNSNFEEEGGAENFINVRWVNIRIRLTDLRSYA